MLGPDLFNGQPAQLTQFKNSTGATYPLLLNGASGTGNENLLAVYGDRDNYAVINKAGVVRYQAYDLWPYGNRYHLPELRATIDSLVSLTAVDGVPWARELALTASPNPFRDATRFELVNPTGAPQHARVTIFDLAGRRVASPWSADVPPGPTEFRWDGRRDDGARLQPGVYVAWAQAGNRRVIRRVLLVR